MKIIANSDHLDSPTEVFYILELTNCVGKLFLFIHFLESLEENPKNLSYTIVSFYKINLSGYSFFTLNIKTQAQDPPLFLDLNSSMSADLI